jgi:uncharacterized protein YjbI with pentapeptide repeats
MEKLEITNTKKKLVMEDVCMDGSTFTNVSGKALLWDDVNLTGTKIKNANLSDLEIKGAQLGGAHFQHIGLPSIGHTHHNPDIKHRPMRFENCDMNNSFIIGCDLSGVEIKDCTLEGMKINGIEVIKLLKAFQSSEK